MAWPLRGKGENGLRQPSTRVLSSDWLEWTLPMKWVTACEFARKKLRSHIRWRVSAFVSNP